MSRINSQVGFTLLELAVAIFIVSLLLGSVLVPLTAQVEQRQAAETQRVMEDIREALLGFAAANGYMPCPDVRTGGTAPFNDGIEDPNDGREDATATGLCSSIAGSAPNSSASGNVPWATLGLGMQDSWGNRFTYTVLESYARRAPAVSFGLGTTGGLRVCTSSLPSPCATTATTITTNAIAVIVSHGKNGLGAISATTNLPNPAATADEFENQNNDRDVVSRTHSDVNSSPFDDMVIWLPKFTLNSRMIAAGKLP